LEAVVQRLEVTVQHVTEQLPQDSRTSSRPPSSDPPQAIVKRPRRERSGRRPGGQPGHPGQARTWVPVEEVDPVMPLWPVCCQHCRAPLHGEEPQPQRRQVTELPPVNPIVTEYQLHRWVCPGCGEVNQAEVPPGVPTGGFGPRVQAITALCTGAYHLSKRTTQHVRQDWFGGSMGRGTVANLEQATVQALAAPVAEARADVPAQPAAYVDDTSWREGRARAWLWTAVTTWVTVFLVRLSRSAKVAQELLGEPCWGWLVTDRWSASSWYPAWRRQFGWAHLLRDLEAMIARGGHSAASGNAVRAHVRQMLHWWHRVRDGTLAPPSFETSMRPIRQEVERLLEAGQTWGVPKTEGVCREILKRRHALWTFVRHADVEPTNNPAERAIHPGVRWRKGSFGPQSPAGSRCVEVMMTVVATLKPQHSPVLDDLTAACEAALRGVTAPSLLPTAAYIQTRMRPAA